MSNDLILKPKTEIAPQSQKKDILELYGVPALMDKVVKNERHNLLNALGMGAGVTDAINKLLHSNDFIVEIPSGLRKLMEEGKAAFDHSAKMPGAFTPNVRGEDGKLIGQAVIAEKIDPQAVTQCLSNLAMMAMVQSVMSSLDVIEHKLDELKKGQENDRIGNIIGPFKSFMDLYPSFKSQEQLVNAAILANNSMQTGLAQLHLQINEEYERVNKSPDNMLEYIWLEIKSIISRAPVKKLQNDYTSFVYDIQLYNRLTMLSDFVLFLSGNKEAISRNHQKMVKYCDQWLDDKFHKRMNFLMAGKTEDLSNIYRFNQNLELALNGYMHDNLLITCKKDEVKYLNINQDGERG